MGCASSKVVTEQVRPSEQGRPSVEKPEIVDEPTTAGESEPLPPLSEPRQDELDSRPTEEEFENAIVNRKSLLEPSTTGAVGEADIWDEAALSEFEREFISHHHWQNERRAMSNPTTAVGREAEEEHQHWQHAVSADCLSVSVSDEPTELKPMGRHSDPEDSRPTSSLLERLRCALTGGQMTDEPGFIPLPGGATWVSLWGSCQNVPHMD
eukprot:Protomagalhaensia_sp_Gyna_25__248@NODE_1117_length_2174_cov_50_737705_g886_i0_p2_GENE_NODE_1117_length_2174_cov_50_737705_g886_i0NODE_1117_length_2174_cov_50_737705_g886_i0_p2_ORF_typecomplete_len210_score34_49Imm31/PF15591_6/0_06_NODE_1117_length_2174_cov_50_737705_g886_i035664